MSETPDKIFHIDDVSDDALTTQNMSNTANISNQMQTLSDYLRSNSSELNSYLLQTQSSQLVNDYLSQNRSDQFDYGIDLMTEQNSNFIENRVI
jgi:hypothetical protein